MRGPTRSPLAGVARLRCLVLAGTVVAAFGLIAARQAQAQPSFTEGTSPSALPSGADASESFSFTSTSCESAGSCIAVGYYIDATGGQQAMVLPITNGTPGTAVEVPLPVGAATGSSQTASLQSVSCGAADSCYAVGTYKDSGNNQEAMAVPITGGLPGAASEVLPSSTNSPYLTAVSCWSAISCVAVGGTSSGSNRLTLTVTIKNGVVQAGTQVPLPSDADGTPPTFDELSDVSCTPDGSCVAVGTYTYAATYFKPLVVTYSNGVPGTGVGVTEPSNAASVGHQEGQLSDLDCPAAGTCTAIGQYYVPSTSLYQLFETQITNGNPTAGVEIPLPAGGDGGPFDSAAPINRLGCASAGSCVAVGWDIVSSGIQPLSALITGVSRTSSHVTLPADADTGAPNAYLQDVGCEPSGPCVAAGYYTSSTGHTEAMIVPIAGTSVGSATTAAAPANESTSSPYAELDTISCGSSGSCAAVGTEKNATGTYQPYVLSLQSPLSIGTSSLSAGALGVAYPSTTLSASGGWGTYSWSVSSGTLPAGLSLNAQTGVISGTPTAAGSATFTVQVSAAGVPTQTATQSLTIKVLAPDLAVRGGRLIVKSNRFSVSLACSDAPCSGVALLETGETIVVKHGNKRLRRHLKVVIGRSAFSLAAGQSASLSATLNGFGIRRLKVAKGHRLPVTIVANATAGNSVTRRATLTETVRTHRKKR